MESGEIRTERRRGSEHGRVGRSGPAPDLLDIFPSQRARRAADTLAEIAAERARDELAYQRKSWQLDLERQLSSLDHQRQMELQAELKGTLGLLRAGLVTIVIGVAIGELMSGGTLVPELMRFVRAALP